METLFLKTRPAATRNDSIRLCGEALRTGKLVAFPTETVYGLGANIFLERSVNKIFSVKRRPADNPLIVHVASFDQARELMQKEPRYFRELSEAFWPGALTLVVKRNAAVQDCVTTGLDTVALRMPDHPIALRLIESAGVPLAAPSANLSGTPSPTTADAVYSDLKGKIFAVLDGGKCRIGIESTVLDLTRRSPVILRPGIITKEQLEGVIGSPVRFARSTSMRPASPGMKYVHYAPKTPLMLFRWTPMIQKKIQRFLSAAANEGRRVGLIAPDEFAFPGPAAFYSLRDGTAAVYARRIYDAFRYFDNKNCEVLVCPGIPETGIGVAVMNRLRKAASKII